MAERANRISQIIDVGTTGGDWTFKQKDLVFGPLPARAIVEKLYIGELSGDTLIAPSDHETDFKSLRDVPFFAVHLAKAEARLRVQRDTNEFKTMESRGAKVRTTVAILLIGGTLVSAGWGAYVFMERRQTRLQQEIDDIPITGNPPELASAAGERSGDDEVAIPLPGGPSADGRHATHRGPVPGTAAAKPTTDGMAAINYDKNSIIGAEVRQKPQLIPCIKQELARMPDFRGNIRFTVAVANDGKVARLWMEDAQFKEGPLQQCFWQKMSTWKFVNYEGERATLSDSFRVGK